MVDRDDTECLFPGDLLLSPWRKCDDSDFSEGAIFRGDFKLECPIGGDSIVDSLLLF